MARATKKSESDRLPPWSFEATLRDPRRATELEVWDGDVAEFLHVCDRFPNLRALALRLGGVQRLPRKLFVLSSPPNPSSGGADQGRRAGISTRGRDEPGMGQTGDGDGRPTERAQVRCSPRRCRGTLAWSRSHLRQRRLFGGPTGDARGRAGPGEPRPDPGRRTGLRPGAPDRDTWAMIVDVDSHDPVLRSFLLDLVQKSWVEASKGVRGRARDRCFRPRITTGPAVIRPDDRPSGPRRSSAGSRAAPPTRSASHRGRRGCGRCRSGAWPGRSPRRASPRWP